MPATSSSLRNKSGKKTPNEFLRETKERAEAETQRLPSIESFEELEQERFKGPRRWRRKGGRTKFVAIRTFPTTHELIGKIADAQQKHLGEVIEDAIYDLASKLGIPHTREPA